MSGLRHFWVGLSLVFSLAVVAAFVAPMFGFDVTTPYLYTPVNIGETQVYLGAVLLIGAAAFALLGLMMAFLIPPAGGRGTAALAFLLPAALIGYLQFFSVSSMTITEQAQTSATTEPAPGGGVIEFTPSVGDGTQTPAEQPEAPAEKQE